MKEVNGINTAAALGDADAAMATLRAAEKRYAALALRQDTLNADLDSYWLIYNAALVLLMQAGLALYEAGSVRQVNQSSVFFKNVLVCAVVALTWWAIGYALAFGNNLNSTRNGFLGNGAFFLASDGTADLADRVYGRWFFEWTYALIPTTIVTMACAERLRVNGIIFVSVIISGFVYPTVAHWTWSQSGWASPFAENIGRMGDQGVLDFAGGGTIFLVGGAAGLAATIALGARTRRFDDDHVDTFRARNKLYIVFGALLIWFTSFAYTTGRTLKLSGPQGFSGAAVASKVLINSVLGSVGGFIGGFPLYYLLTSGDRLNIAALTDSILAGIAATAAGVAVVEPWAALTIGAIGGLLYTVFRGIIEGRQVDDSLNGFAIFAIPGFWGLIAVGILATEYGVTRAYGKTSASATGQISSTKYGLFYQGLGDVLWPQIVGAIAILAWSFVVTFIIVRVTKAFAETFLRLESEEEKFGADLAHYAEYQVSEAFVDGMDNLYPVLSTATNTVDNSSDQGVPRWLVVDYRNVQSTTVRSLDLTKK